MATECDPNNPFSAIICPITDIATGVGDVVEGVSGVVSFAQDPFGATLQALKDGARSLATDVLPFLTSAIQPDLSAGFFIRAYAISFAAAILVLMVIMITLFVRTAKGDLAGRDLVQSIAGYVPMFFIGAMFGPLAGMLLVSLFHALTDSVITWALGSAQQIIDGLIALIDKTDPATMPGGVILACILMALLLVGLFVVVVILLCQLVTLYFTGVLIPLFLVFVADPNRRRLALGMSGLWVGILASHPLLFFLLGFAFSIMGDTIATAGEKDGMQTLVTFVVALIAIYIAAFSPLMLMKFAPIIAPAFTPTPSGGGGGGNTIGHSTVSGATNEYGNGGQEGSGSPSTVSSSTPSGGGSTSSSSTNTTTTDKTLTDAAANNENASAGGEKVGAGAGSSAEASSGAATGAGSTAAGAEASGAAAGAESTAAGLAEAGAAESATGAGAAVGVPTLLAAAAAATGEAAKRGADSAAAQAAAPMDDPTVGESAL